MNTTAQKIELVEDIPEEYDLISDSQDIDDVLESIDKREHRTETGCLFVLVGQSEYISVLQCESNVPYNWKRVWELL